MTEIFFSVICICLLSVICPVQAYDSISSGSVAPDFNLMTSDGQEKITLKNFKDKVPVVIFFGSYTSPQFFESSKKMEKIYRTYKYIARFFIVYIEEDRPSNCTRPAEYAGHIIDARNYGERCMAASLFISEGNITIPVIIDNMNNSVKDDYSAWPARVFIIKKDGIVELASHKGTDGFKDGLKETARWLEEYRKRINTPNGRMAFIYVSDKTDKSM
ncbi:MAG: deiodinase-like protein [Candidatus Eremiobacterota bacterium]